MLPSGPGGVRAPAHAWRLAEAEHAPPRRARNTYFGGLAPGASRPLRIALLAPPELLEPRPLLGDKVLEFDALLGCEDLRDLVLHLLDGERGRQLHLAAVPSKLRGRALHDGPDLRLLIVGQVELAGKAPHELRPEPIGPGRPKPWKLIEQRGFMALWW